MAEMITRDMLFIKDEDGQMIIAPNAIERICQIEKQKKALDKEYKKFKDVLTDGMEHYGIKRVETDDLLVTYVEPTDKTVLDTKRLWDEHRDIAFACQKDQHTKGYAKVTVR